VAVFVNSALVIVSGATFYNNPDADFDDLYSLYALFQDSISDAAATIFAVSLLFSGVSAGIVATIAEALVACNYVLAIGLIFVTLPLVWYVTHERYMGVASDDGTCVVSFRNSVIGIGVAWFIWIVIVFMDIATVVLLGLGVTSDN
jgi:metal iron transporter